jgi:DNA repair exonuclease SbcCD ATPase subunit
MCPQPIPDWRETVGLEPRTVDYLQAVLRRENLHLINKRDEEMLERVKTETRCLHDDSSAITARLAGMRLSTQKAEGGEGQEQRREALRVAVAEKQAEVAAKQDAIEELQSTLLLPLPPLAMPPDTEGESEAEELARAVGPLRKRDEALRDRIQGLRKEWDELNAAIPSLKGTISEASARTQALLPVHAKVAKEVEQKEAELAKAQEALKRYANTASNVVLQRARDKEER